MVRGRKTRSRSISEIMVWIISVLVIISMAVGFLIMVVGPPDVEPIPVVTTPVLDDVEDIINGAELLEVTVVPTSQSAP